MSFEYEKDLLDLFFSLVFIKSKNERLYTLYIYINRGTSVVWHYSSYDQQLWEIMGHDWTHRMACGAFIVLHSPPDPCVH